MPDITGSRNFIDQVTRIAHQLTSYEGICCISTLNANSMLLLQCTWPTVKYQSPMDALLLSSGSNEKHNSKEYMNNQDMKIGVYLIEY